MTLLYQHADQKTVGLHALLIGVGAYPHLDGGHSQPKFDLGKGMTQLSSPYRSVAALAAWLQNGQLLNGTPLCSLRVLASSDEGGDNSWDNPTMSTIESEVGNWFKDANQHEDNFALFYFCGHGLLIGSVTALLAQDFGSNEQNPFSHSFDPAKFESGMLSCQASRQLFILDTCSTSPRKMRERYQAISPSALVQPVNGHERLGITKQAEIRASELGTAAYGQPNKPSVFMEQFLKSMQGAGAIKDGNGKWVIKTNSLRTGVDWLVQRSENSEAQLVGFGSVSADFPFHELNNDPVVPVKVICEPQERLGFSSLRTKGHSRDIPSLEPWHLDLPYGEYEFEASDNETGTVYVKQEHATPQYTVVSIKCGDEA
jgi:hypothetical protein